MREDVLYSGTVSAAMEAVTLGIPGVAISFAGRDPEFLGSYEALLGGLVRRIVEVPAFPPNPLLNVAVAAVEASEVRGVNVTKDASRFFSEGLTRVNAPCGKAASWIAAAEIACAAAD